MLIGCWTLKFSLSLKWTSVSAGCWRLSELFTLQAMLEQVMLINTASLIKIARKIFYPEVVLLNCVRIFYTSPTPPFPPLCFCLAMWYKHARGPRSPPSHLPMSLAAKSPSRDLLKWNIWFHFEVPKHLNHLAGKDAARVVKLLCLAAGSPSADREHRG